MEGGDGEELDGENMNDVIAKLDLAMLRSDNEIEMPGNGEDRVKERTGNGEDRVKERKTSNDEENRKDDQVDSKGKSSSCKKSNSFLFVKKIISGSGSSGERVESLSKSKRDQMMKDVKVESLPQRFLVKYVGNKPCEGLWGIKNTRSPVDSLVDDLRHLEKGEDLPLINVKVTGEGMNVHVHPSSKSKMKVTDVGLVPLQFISYAVQDTRYSKIFAFILVREMSSRKRTTECHAYLCDGVISARKMALSVALAFRELEKSLKGKTHKFQVDLRSSDELENELMAKSPGGTASEFDA